MDDSDEYEYGSSAEDESDGMCLDEDNSNESDDEDFGFDTGAEMKVESRKAPYQVLKRAELMQRREHAVAEVTSVLSVSDEVASRVLRRFKWDVNRVHEEWFSDMDAVREDVGIQDPAAEPSTNQVTCQICFDNFRLTEMRCSPCRHYFCGGCWSGYISTAISGGPACLDLRCPLPLCKAAVPTELVRAAAPPADWEKYATFALRSFVEDNKRMSWCTGKWRWSVRRPVCGGLSLE